jgi:hypothetical protein
LHDGLAAVLARLATQNALVLLTALKHGDHRDHRELPGREAARAAVPKKTVRAVAFELSASAFSVFSVLSVFQKLFVVGLFFIGTRKSL